MRDPETIETELISISEIADDSVKFERIVASGAPRIRTKCRLPFIM